MPPFDSFDPASEPAPGPTVTPLVLLPGLDGTDVFFRPLIDLLPDWIHPEVIQFPDAGPYDYDSLLQRVRDRIRHLPACYLLASSFSGPLAVMLAAAEPTRVRGLIFAASFVRAPRRFPLPYRLIANAPTVGAVRTLRRLPVWLLKPSLDDFRLAKRETWARVSAWGLAGRARAVLGCDVRPLLRQCRQPVLALAFADDHVVARPFVEEVVSCSGSGRMVTVPGGHMGLFTHPKEPAAEILRFIHADGGRRSTARAGVEQPGSR